jgi:hypothetical protein
MSGKFWFARFTLTRARIYLRWAAIGALNLVLASGATVTLAMPAAPASGDSLNTPIYGTGDDSWARAW